MVNYHRSNHRGTSQVSEYLHSPSPVAVPTEQYEDEYPLLQELGWMEDGLCRQVDPDLFFPDPENAVSSSKEAKKICKKCPVKNECLEYAVTAKVMSVNGYDTGYVTGVWGGTYDGQRQKIRVERGITHRMGWTAEDHGVSLNVYTEGGEDGSDTVRDQGTASEWQDDLG